MRRPTKVKVGAFTYAVEFERDITDAKEAEGTVLTTQGRILIHDGMPGDRTREAFLHELLHAAIDQTPLRAKDKDGRDDEEDTVAALSPLLFRVLRENPRLVAWLVEQSA
jgi:hypothetical protein